MTQRAVDDPRLWDDLYFLFTSDPGQRLRAVATSHHWLRAYKAKFMLINSQINIATHHHWTVARPTLSLSQWLKPTADVRHLLVWVSVMWSGCAGEFCVSFFVFRSCSGNLLPTWCVDSCRPTTVIRNSSFCEIGAWRKCFRTSKAGNTYYRITNKSAILLSELFRVTQFLRKSLLQRRSSEVIYCTVLRSCQTVICNWTNFANSSNLCWSLKLATNEGNSRTKGI